MIMADNKQNTNPNVPNSGNIPKLRFPEFSEDWVQYNCSDLLEFYSTNSLSWEQLGYENNELLNLHYGLIHVGLPTLVKIKQNNLPSIKPEFQPKNYTLCKNGDVAFADASEDTNEVAKPIEFYDCSDKQIVCGLHTIHGRDKLNATEVGFKGYAFSSTPFHHKIRRLAQGSKIYSISSKNFAEVTLGVPTKKEQRKIVDLLSKLDERIATQNKIIEQLQSLIKGIRVRLFSFDNYDIKYLGDLCSITTGKLDANAMVENGKYPFFTCAEDTFRIDEYAFDTEALLISGNGANLGYIHYYNGKFNAYQRTYVLDKFSVEVMYLKYYLETFLNQRINQEVNVGNTPYIVLSTLTKMKIKIPDISQQRNIINVLSNLNLKLNQEKDILSAYQTQKAYLLRNLFI